MVFGNMGDDSGTGVAFTRDPNTGEKVLFGEYLTNAQGEDVVAGIRTPQPISHMKDELPESYAEFERIGQRLEKHYKDVQDLEFTIERGRLFMLQTRSAKRTAAAAVRIAADMVDEGIITEREALSRIEPAHVDQLLRDQFDSSAKQGAQRVTAGLNASPGAAVGRAVFNADRAFDMAQQGEKVILVRIETSPDDFHGMAAAQGVLTARGGATSHAAVVARQIGKPCVAGCASLVIDYGTKSAHVNGLGFSEGEWISLDGTTGEVFIGAAADDRGTLRGPGRAPEGARVGRPRAPTRGLDERGQAGRGGHGAPLRRAGHRAVPNRAHVPRGGAPGHRPRRDPRRLPGHARQGEARSRRNAQRSTTPRPLLTSTRRWPSSRFSSRAISRASSRPWTACRSSFG